MNQVNDIRFLATWYETANDIDREAESCQPYKRLRPALVKAEKADLNNEGKAIEQRFDGRTWEDIQIHTVDGRSYSPNVFEY